MPDLSGGGVGGYCVPNAQHAVRQAKLLAKNLVAVLRGELPREYFHKNLGAVAGLGLYNGVFQSGNIALKGFVAWVAHRGYHGLAMPSWERKWRVLWGWWNNFWLAPRPREPVDGAEPALRLRGVRRAPASAAARRGREAAPATGREGRRRARRDGRRREGRRSSIADALTRAADS